MNCCARNEDENEAVLTWYSMSCTGSDFVTCPIGSCGSAPASPPTPSSGSNGCPASHPYAFDHGHECCARNEDANEEVLTLDSMSCTGDDYVMCPIGTCGSQMAAPIYPPTPSSGSNGCP